MCVFFLFLIFHLDFNVHLPWGGSTNTYSLTSLAIQAYSSIRTQLYNFGYRKAIQQTNKQNKKVLKTSHHYAEGNGNTLALTNQQQLFIRHMPQGPFVLDNGHSECRRENGRDGDWMTDGQQIQTNVQTYRDFITTCTTVMSTHKEQ